MNKHSHKKVIIQSIENVIEDLIVILECFKVNENDTELTEMQNLVTAKRKMMLLIEEVVKIIQNLVCLKLLKRRGMGV